MENNNNNNVIAVFIQHNMNYAIKMMNCRVLLRYFVHKMSLTIYLQMFRRDLGSVV